MCILHGCIIKLNKAACYMVATNRCKLETGSNSRANLTLALDPCPGKGLDSLSQLVDSKCPVRFFTGSSGDSHLAELTDCEEPHVCILSATSALSRLLPLHFTPRKSRERGQVIKPNWVDFPTFVNRKGQASANSCASDHLLPQYHNEWTPIPEEFFVVAEVRG